MATRSQDITARPAPLIALVLFLALGGALIISHTSAGISLGASLLIVALFYFLGMFMETLSTIIVMTPVLLPVVTKLGIDPIHFGIIFIVTNEVAFLTPPLGVNLFVASKLADVSLEKLSLHVLPHILAITICIIILAYFPQLTLFLPHLLGYGK